MGKHHDNTFPGENNIYRVGRDTLVTAETELWKRIEAVA